MAKYRSGARDRRLTIKELPEQERPREKLLQQGAEALGDADLLAIIIRDGTPQESAIDLANRMLAEFGTLREIRQRSPKELCAMRGIGPARAAQVLAALTLASRVGKKTMEKGQPFTGSRAVFDHFHPLLRFAKQESFYTILLDTKNRVLRGVDVSRGGLSAAMVNPRDVLRHAIAESAAAIIVLHNHPSGDPKPSADDFAVTKRVKEACQLAGIRFLDHLIIGEEGYVSLADEGRL